MFSEPRTVESIGLSKKVDTIPFLKTRTNTGYWRVIRKSELSDRITSLSASHDQTPPDADISP